MTTYQIMVVSVSMVLILDIFVMWLIFRGRCEKETD